MTSGQISCKMALWKYGTVVALEKYVTNYPPGGGRGKENGSFL